MLRFGHHRDLLWALALSVTPAMAAQPDLAVPYRGYVLPLSTYAPTPGRVAGVLLSVRVNGGPPLRLLLDTGAADVVLDKKAAERSGLVTSKDLVLVCAGGSSTKTLKAGMAQTVYVGPLTFRNYQVNVAPTKLGDGLDGVIPMSIFRGFLVRLDLPQKSLELDPYPEGPPASTEGFARALPTEDLLFLPATLNESKDGYVLIDTGSSYTAVSRPAARALKSLFTSAVQIMAADGAFTGEYITPGVRFQIAGRELMANQVVALDLSNMSRYHDIDVAGVLGFPDLRSKVLTVNYRDSLVKIASGR